MSEVNYHGNYSSEEYKLGEKQYRSINRFLFEYKTYGVDDEKPEILNISLWWPDWKSQNYTRLKGPVRHVFRNKEAPFVELGFLEYDELGHVSDDDPALVLIKEWFQKRRDNRAADNLKQAGIELSQIANFASQLSAIELQAGIVPEGIYIEEPVIVDLSRIKVTSYELIYPDVVQA